jgi:hypothetical protein
MLAASLPRSVCDVLEPRTLRYARTVPVEYLQRLLGTTEPARLHTFLTADAAGQYFKLNGDKVRQDFLAPALSRAKFLRAPVFANNIIHNFRPGRPLLYPTFEDGGVIPEPLIHSIREAADRCIVSVQWQDEDLLMLDNTRYLHGRRAVVDPDRAIWTQFSDADF